MINDILKIENIIVKIANYRSKLLWNVPIATKK